MRGFGIASGGSVRSVLETLATVDPLTILDDGTATAVSLRRIPDAIDLSRQDMGASWRIERGAPVARMTLERIAADQTPGEISIGYYDCARDYQTGLQRAHFGIGRRSERIELPAALMPGEAKALAERKMAEVSVRSVTSTIRLPYRALALRPGDLLRHPADGGLWRVTEMTVERMVVELALERMLQIPLTPSSAADGGRVAPQNGLANGETVLHVLDLPPLFDELPAVPRIWIAASGKEQGWRRADIALSLDSGGSWQSIYTATGGSVAGVTLTALGAGASTLWDDRNAVEVELDHEGMWLEGRADESLLAGANLALIDDELVQFGHVEQLGGHRFRLSRLLRGRRGTEWASADHEAGGRFILIEPAVTGVADLPVSRLGSSIRFRGTGPGEDPAAAEAVTLLLKGRALLPPSPVHVTASLLADGSVNVQWIRRSRQGWGGWIDGVDAPLGEESERYRVTLRQLGGSERIVDVSQSSCTHALADRLADGGDISRLSVAIVQLSAIAGPGMAAAADFVIDD